MYAKVYNHTTGIHYYLFSRMEFEISQVSKGQKQAFSKRLLICLQSHPLHIYTDTQAWDCHAKKLLQLFCGCKGTKKF